MNLSDLCPRGLELYTINRNWVEQWERSQLLQIKQEAIKAYQAYRQHVEGCELCEEK